MQCGFCIPGQLMAGDEILRAHAHPTRAAIEEGIAGNLCRCGCYYQIVEAIEAAAEGRAGERAAVASRSRSRDAATRRRPVTPVAVLIGAPVPRVGGEGRASPARSSTLPTSTCPMSCTSSS